jgi:hypothetical protein
MDWALEHHANPAAHLHRINLLVVEILAIKNHATLEAAAFDQVVHAIERPQHGALAAAGGADEGCDLAAGNLHIHTTHGFIAAVADADVLKLHAKRAGCLLGVGRGGHRGGHDEKEET